MAETRTFAFSGIEAVPVRVSARVAPGLSSFTVSGFAEASARGISARVRGAFAGIGLSLPTGRVLVEVSAAGAPREGAHHDLPVALSVLAAMGVVQREELSCYAALGGLAPDGTLVQVPGVLSAAIGASAAELGLICPAVQGGEAAWAGSIEVLAAPDLLALVAHFRGSQVLTPPIAPGPRVDAPDPRLDDIPVADAAKRALEAAATNGRALALVGPRDACSKLAACLPGLLPDLGARSALEVSMVHSTAGLLDGGRLIRRPPFRVVDADTPDAVLFGGGRSAAPGESSLAHGGVLLLDGVERFSATTLKSLRRVMGSGVSGLARQGAAVTYPARFRLLGSADPARAADPGSPLAGVPRGVFDDVIRIEIPGGY